MTLPVVLSVETQDEFDEVADWYEQQAGLGSAFTLAVREVILRLAGVPLAHQVVSKALRRAVVRKFPFNVYNRVEPDRVAVVAVLDTRRDPSTWQGGV